MIVSICVVAYNEQDYLNDLLMCICQQTYPHEFIEVVLIDSMSTDETALMMSEFKENHPEFWGVQVLKNEKKIQATGWNVAINHYKGDLITRIDAHSTIPSDFIEKNVTCIQSGETISGGHLVCVSDTDNFWEKTLLKAETSLFGSGIAPFRRKVGRFHVKLMSHPTYKREVFESVGLFNEHLGRTEDNEMSYRIRKAGYQYCYDSSIESYHHVRNSLKSMIKQKFLNGYWIGLTIGYNISCLSLYHFVPGLFVLSILLTTIFSIFGYAQLALVLWITYIGLAILMALLASDRKMMVLILPFLFCILHVSYGLGSFWGIIIMPYWKSKID
ncbi:MAG: glycosyltransferase family 2 protein [Clostridiales bacterium]|nr:glycosyltransferase family 2 protein [Clostridiales bacterium]